MALRKYVRIADAPSGTLNPLNLSSNVHGNAQLAGSYTSHPAELDVDIDIREVYFLIMHFLSAGPCHRTYGQFWNELLEHQLLPRRYHAWYSRSGVPTGDENDDGMSFPLSYNKLVERYPHIEKDHLIKLLKQLITNTSSPSRGIMGGDAPNAADVPTLLGRGLFSLVNNDRDKGHIESDRPPSHMRWPHMRADQVHGLGLREIGGGFARHQRAPSVRAACYAIAKPSTMVQKMQNIKRVRGHRNAVYCAIFDRSGRYVITGSDDRLVKIWSMETAYCLASCRGHEGDITDLAVSFNNVLVASSSNDCIIRVWRVADGLPIAVLRGHTSAVTAIAFSPRPSNVYQLLSSSDDGTCRLWDARYSQFRPRIYIPRQSETVTGKNTGPSSSVGPQSHQIFCCAFNANGTVFVTGSSDTLARVWNACKPNTEDDQPIHEMDVLCGHENDVNYVQFSGCAVTARFSSTDCSKEDNIPKFKNYWFCHDNIVTCSRDGSAIIWIPRSRRSHTKTARWTQAYHLKVPPPPMPPQPPRGGPRQRILPTPRGVNMIMWSLDNRFVLAAIMDCRICVWNATDGSLVHSLTGHTESTYVLDVHPFNPRIAMSAGYDGKTILWDIWEGTPIKIYEVSRFKLVDGKFSPDGTSIILSDDVGQLYILSTGQGESQNDAKYDQFFLGDYRPLIQDTYGSVLDQETQLAPYRRNLQDPLCDSGMIPYPEPYQTMYQQRRLGALGIEWRPSSLKLAVGPDFSLDQGYQLQPLADLDVVIDPLPEFIDVMDWEPENELQTDDNDSEYNIAEEYSIEEDKGSISSTSSADSECSAEDTEDEEDSIDGLRRSKRKKQKAEVDIMTSSGRRVKRRNLDESDGNVAFRYKQTRKSGNGQKSSRRKSSTSKSLRPQRAAARNARSFFSKITGASADGEEEDGSEGEISGSESFHQDSNIESEESSRSLLHEQRRHSKGKGIYLDECEDVTKHDVPESQVNSGTRRKLVLKLPIRDTNKHAPLESTSDKCDQLNDIVGTSSEAQQEATDGNGNIRSSPGHDCSFINAKSSLTERRGQYDKLGGYLNLSAGYKDEKIRWGGVRARSSKRLKLVEIMPLDANNGSDIHLYGHKEKESEVDGHVKSEEDGIDLSCGVDTTSACNMDEMTRRNEKTFGCENNGFLSGEASDKEQLDFGSYDKSKCVDATDYANHFQNGTDHLPEPKGIPAQQQAASDSPTFCGHTENNGCDAALHRSLDIKHNSVPEVQSEGTIRTNLDLGADGSRQSDDSTPAAHDLAGSRSVSKMFNVVYRRSKTSRVRANSDGGDGDGGGGGGVSSSNGNNNSLHEATTDGSRRTRSMGLRASTANPGNLKNDLRLEHLPEDMHRCARTRSTNRGQHPHEEWGSSSKLTVGLRSTRNRKSSSLFSDSTTTERRKSYQSSRKGSWLILTTHEEGSRYIPQLGDKVVYLRQGHQEYINYAGSKEKGPWATVRGNIRTVEFCKIESLDYATASGSGDSCCKMTLKFIDPTSDVCDRTFSLMLPEVTGFPDFLVERTRFDSAIRRNWTCRDKCKVWWKNENDEDGSWWDGRVLFVKPKSVEFPDSPWERYTVQYKTEPTETHLHSPWELFDAGTQWEEPRIDEDCRSNLLSALAKLEQSANRVQDRYGVQMLKQVSQKTNFTNRFPVPLSLDVIHSRLENNYYRSLEAVKHDVAVMLSNAESYSQRNTDLSTKVKRLSEWFTQTLSSLQPSDVHEVG